MDCSRGSARSRASSICSALTGLLASLGAEELRINGAVGGVGGLFAHVDALVVVVEENLPVGFASTHGLRQPGRTQGHAHKPQLEAQRRDRVRTWAQPSPLRHEWQALCVGKRRPDG